MKYAMLCLAGLAISVANSANAQAQVQTQPLKPSAAVVPATDTTAGVVSSTIKGIGRVVADTLENNAITRTLNNLLGRAVVTPTQPGYSALPDPRSFQSTRYPNSFKPVTPVMSTYGRSPSAIFPK